MSDLKEAAQPIRFRVTVIDNAHPDGIPFEQWVRRDPTAAPPQRKPLTESEIARFAWETYLEAEGIWTSDSREDLIAFARAIEQAHGIKEKL